MISFRFAPRIRLSSFKIQGLHLKVLICWLHDFDYAAEFSRILLLIDEISLLFFCCNHFELDFSISMPDSNAFWENLEQDRGDIGDSAPCIIHWIWHQNRSFNTNSFKFTEFVIKISFFFFLILLSGLFLKTRDFLQPLEREEKGGEAADGGSVPAERNASSISHVGAGQGAEKLEGSAQRVLPIGLQTKPEPDYGSRSTTTSYGSYAGGVSYTLWDDNDTASRGNFASARCPLFLSSSPLSNPPHLSSLFSWNKYT